MASAWRPQEDPAMQGWVGQPQFCRPRWLGRRIYFGRNQIPGTFPAATQPTAWHGPREASFPSPEKKCILKLWHVKEQQNLFVLFKALSFSPFCGGHFFQVSRSFSPQPRECAGVDFLRDPEEEGSALLPRSPRCVGKKRPPPARSSLWSEGRDAAPLRPQLSPLLLLTL